MCTFFLQAQSVCDLLAKVQAAIRGGTLQSGGIAAILTAVELLAKDTCSTQAVRDAPHASGDVHTEYMCLYDIVQYALCIATHSCMCVCALHCDCL